MFTVNTFPTAWNRAIYRPQTGKENRAPISLLQNGFRAPLTRRGREDAPREKSDIQEFRTP